MKIKVTQSIKRTATLVTASAMASVATYFICDSSYSQQIAEMQSRIKQLQTLADEAKVTQRVSEQMEDIAFQQKIVSDKQREEAENQRKIADIERGKAEYERGMARDAANRALASAREAEDMRLLAERQKEEAEKSMREAELARAQTDTLYFLSLGESLAQASLTQGNNIDNMSRLLAYSSWYYTRQYGGDVYSESIFKALAFNSDIFERVPTSLQGNVRRVRIIRSGGVAWTIAVTDHEELYYSDGKDRTGVWPMPGLYMRDLSVIDDRRCAIITADGIVYILDYTAIAEGKFRKLAQTRLSKGNWLRIVPTKDCDTLLCLSDNRLLWLDARSMAVVAEKQLEGSPHTLGCENGIIHIFCDDNSHYITDCAGVMARMPLSTIDSRITAYHYLSGSGRHVLGTHDGTIYIVGSDGEILHRLAGHDGGITALGDDGRFLISTGYDYRLRFWDLNVSTSVTSRLMGGFSKWPLSFDIDPVSKMMWIGNADGHINKLCIDADTNAASVQSLITSDFTQPEWERYIGAHIPFRSFMANKENVGKEASDE